MVWVAICASAGGLEALQALASQLPADANAVYLVAQHLSPRHQTMMVQLVQRSTSLRVESAQHGLVPLPGRIYITPPNRDIHVARGRIQLATPPKTSHAPKPSADALFASLAEEIGSSTVAVVLSGTGSDGARGVRSIHAAGGMCIAQDPKSAKYGGMPQSAIDTGCIDVVLPPEEIATHLTQLLGRLPLPENLLSADDNDEALLAELLQRVLDRTRVNLKDYKKATIKRRIARRMIARGIDSLADYLALARQEDQEVDLLFQDILISVTEFYRDRNAFDALAQFVQRIVAGRGPQQPVRVWNVGCASGEEVYTVAMMFAEALGGPQALSDSNLQIFATDIDANALAKARKGQYPKSALQALPQGWRERYFNYTGDTAEIIKPLRNVILFSKHNVVEDPPFMRIDLLCCRNLLIYFESELQRRIFQIFHYALKPHGFLFLGKSESTQQTLDLFEAEDATAKIYSKRASAFESASGAGPVATRTSRRSVAEERALSPSQTRRDPEQLFAGLAARLGDATVLVNENLDIEWVFGELTPFARIGPGAARLNLGELAGDAHRDEIRALAYKAVREASVVTGQPRRLRVDGVSGRSQATVYPIHIGRLGTGRLLIAFRRLPAAETEGDGTADTRATSYVRGLEEELAAAREHLQTVIEELETSNEELQSVNEELQSANEELQSANEELETANEELQSTNEELANVNAELSSKSTDHEAMSTHLRQIKDSLDFPLLVLDRSTRVVSANRAARSLFDIEPGQPPIEKVLPADIDAASVTSLTHQVLATGQTRSLHLDGQQRSFWLRVSPYVDVDGHAAGTVHAYIDYTVQRKSEAELAQARRDAEAANAAKSAFLANMSHDIRTPLGTITGGIFILSRFDVGEEQRKAVLRMIDRGADELQRLTDDFLDFARVESGRIELVNGELNLRETFHKVVDIVRSRADAKGLEFRFVCAQDVPEWVVGDGLKIRQVVLNLLSNAIKFTEHGWVELKVDSTPAPGGYTHICIEVRDTGPGIAREQHSLVFEKFAQGSTVISEHFGGSGLGLAICREFVQLMNGSITLTSEPGAGATFRVELPLKLMLATGGSAAEPPEPVAPIFRTKRAAEQHRVLVVDDHPGNVTILSAYLDYLGCSYDVARGGREAVQACMSRDYAVVLMDLHMSDVNGFEAARQIRELHVGRRDREPRLVAHSANAHADIQARAEAAGMSIVLGKPIDIRALRRALAVSAPAES